MRVTSVLISGLLIGFFGGCKQSAEPTVYTVAKEANATTPTSPVASGAIGPAGEMANSSFSPPVAGMSGHEPEWEVPVHWVSSAGSAMRKASYAVNHPEGALDVAVTAFPGDVGGPLANVNRWRRQIGLDLIGADELDTDYTPLGGQEPGFYTELIGSEQSTLSATFVHDGNSWFFKMTGPTAAIEKERAEFLAVVRGLHFPGH